MQKSNLAKAGIIGLTMFILYKIISKGSAVGNLDFSIKKVAYTFSQQGFILTFFLTAKNVSNENILLNSINGELFFNDGKIGTVNNDLQITILKNNETVLPVAVNLYFLPVVDTITDLISGRLRARSVFTFLGTARIENINFPVKLNYSLA